jgi:hypothetical protein
VDIPDERIEQVALDPTAFQYEVQLSGHNSTGSVPLLAEHIVIGPGVPVGRTSRAVQVITDADQY